MTNSALLLRLAASLPLTLRLVVDGSAATGPAMPLDSNRWAFSGDVATYPTCDFQFTQPGSDVTGWAIVVDEGQYAGEVLASDEFPSPAIIGKYGATVKATPILKGI